MIVGGQRNAVFACALVISAAAYLATGPVLAEPVKTSCSCLVTMPEAGGPIGHLKPLKGDVQISQASGYVVVKADEAVYSGARIMTGLKSSAFLSAGMGCSLDIPARTTVRVDPTEGGMCVSLDTPQAEIVPAGSGPGLLPVLLGGGAVGGAAALILSLHDDNNSVSK